ncbi:hypothetical protein BT96DRAFT_990284 [Gymnopus androsaceus JB14]|uniref:Uncharacterized protein n=1 Tax=Gymnopus androsaceus JB14 TaxID=1447944 RepID=A0A6A4I3Q6_9AGAR|nr:hypothetical protein BT96DRAFT_990284 [Gymnopus androsaceus JB14]
MSLRSSRSRQQSVSTVHSDYDSRTSSRSSKPHSSRSPSVPSNLQSKSDAHVQDFFLTEEYGHHYPQRFSPRNMTSLPPSKLLQAHHTSSLPSSHSRRAPSLRSTASSSRAPTSSSWDQSCRPMNPAPSTSRSMSLCMDELIRPPSTPRSLDSRRPVDSASSGRFIGPYSPSVSELSSSGRHKAGYVWLEEIQPPPTSTSPERSRSRSDDGTVFDYMKGVDGKEYYVVYSTTKPRPPSHGHSPNPMDYYDRASKLELDYALAIHSAFAYSIIINVSSDFNSSSNGNSTVVGDVDITYTSNDDTLVGSYSPLATRTRWHPEKSKSSISLQQNSTPVPVLRR